MKAKLIYIILLVGLTSCLKEEAVYEEYISIAEEAWMEKDTLSFKFDIEETAVQYNIFIELRITDDYNYSNLYTMSSLRASTEKSKFEKKHLLLASPDGKWYGKGNGRIVTLKLPLYSSKIFQKSGTYYLDLKQEMRDNPLEYVTAVGIRVEKGNPVF